MPRIETTKNLSICSVLQMQGCFAQHDTPKKLFCPHHKAVAPALATLKATTRWNRHKTPALLFCPAGRREPFSPAAGTDDISSHGNPHGALS